MRIGGGRGENLRGEGVHLVLKRVEGGISRIGLFGFVYVRCYSLAIYIASCFFNIPATFSIETLNGKHIYSCGLKMLWFCS